METIKINGKEYQLDIDKAKEQGLLKEKDGKPRSWEEYDKKFAGVPHYRGWFVTLIENLMLLGHMKNRLLFAC